MPAPAAPRTCMRRPPDGRVDTAGRGGPRPQSPRSYSGLAVRPTPPGQRAYCRDLRRGLAIARRFRIAVPSTSPQLQSRGRVSARRDPYAKPCLSFRGLDGVLEVHRQLVLAVAEGEFIKRVQQPLGIVLEKRQEWHGRPAGRAELTARATDQLVN